VEVEAVAVKSWERAVAAGRERSIDASTVTIGGGAAAKYPPYGMTQDTFNWRPDGEDGEIVVRSSREAAREEFERRSIGEQERGPRTLQSLNKSGPGNSVPCGVVLPGVARALMP